ncbi:MULTISPECIES: PP2C family serine/threonine-protein phosphatase [unclassified Sphingosinithalassobacter]|uniref:PP2C family serine/threonine-protein phosphatase n=1 Tax=unclassified Sphingosinithalassobacter TaxID=2676235 RepID=UPI00165D6CDD|nr:PP2C family serine/threonine-protein phosphatase [Sphingosinithalassobacter sp. CS137]
MAQTATWRMAGTSVAGARHAEAGEPGQDRHRLHATRSGALIAVASDGAGSAARGAEGAAMLCERIVARLELYFDAGFVKPCSRATLTGACRAVRRAVGEARAAVAAAGADEGLELAAFHATLVGAVMLPNGGGLFFHIGDGAALAIGAEGARWQLSPPSNGEYADTTYFFTDADWRRHLRFSLIGAGFDTIFVMTDGVTELALVQRDGVHEPFMPFFEPIGRYLAAAGREEGEQALSATLDSSAARARTPDDKTLLWARAAGP